jgi:hypothetical protein
MSAPVRFMGSILTATTSRQYRSERPSDRSLRTPSIHRLDERDVGASIYGNGKRGTGILNNELYIGRLVWNRLRYVKNPDTGKRVSRLNPEREWMRKEVPELRIVPDDLWTAAKSRQHQTRHTVRAAGALGAAKRPQYLFSGLTKCGVCGAGFIMSGKNFCDEFTREMNRLRMERRASLSSAKREVGRISTRIKNS